VARRIHVRELDLALRVRRGLVAGTQVRDLFARALVAVGTWEQATQWTSVTSAPVGGTPALFPLPADGPVTIVSTSAVDNVAGVGARTFEVLGPAPDARPATEGPSAPWIVSSVPLNGTTPVQTAASYWGGMAECGGVISAGSAWTNQGTLTVTRVSDSKVLYVIPPLWGHTLTARITVPLGWIGVVRRLVLTWDGDTQAHWRLMIHNLAGVRYSMVGGSVQRENSGTELVFGGGRVIPPGATFWIEAVRDAGGSVASPVMSAFSPLEFYRQDDAA